LIGQQNVQLKLQEVTVKSIASDIAVMSCQGSQVFGTVVSATPTSSTQTWLKNPQRWIFDGFSHFFKCPFSSQISQPCWIARGAIEHSVFFRLTFHLQDSEDSSTLPCQGSSNLGAARTIAKLAMVSMVQPEKLFFLPQIPHMDLKKPLTTHLCKVSHGSTV